jgi:hypothetical protein
MTPYSAGRRDDVEDAAWWRVASKAGDVEAPSGLRVPQATYVPIQAILAPTRG